MAEMDNEEFRIRKFSYASDVFSVFLRVAVLVISIILFINFLGSNNTANMLGSIVGIVVFLYLTFGDYFNSLKTINKKLVVKSIIDSYEVDLEKLRSVCIVGASQKNGTKDFIFEFLDEDGEITKVKSRDVMGYKKLEEFLERNKIKVSNAMKRGVNMKPMKLIATVAIIAIIIITIVYSVKIFQTSDSKNGESGQEDLVIPTTEESVEASSSANIGKFPLPKSSVEETGFKVDKVFLNSRKIYMFSSKEQGTYNFAYVFPSNIQKTDFLICFDLDCVLNSAFHFDKSNLLTQPVTFEAASNSPLNNFQLQTSVIEVLGLIVVSIGEDSFDNDLFPIMKLAVSETDNKDRIEFTAYDVNVV